MVTTVGRAGEATRTPVVHAPGDIVQKLLDTLGMKVQKGDEVVMNGGVVTTDTPVTRGSELILEARPVGG